MEIKFSLDEIQQVAQKILAERLDSIVLFYGSMGAGKTTLIKELAKELNVLDATSSPTFSLVNEYHTTDGTLLYHFDLYRLKTEHEALDFGIDEYLYSGNRCFIEWPEKIIHLLPEHYTKISIHIEPNGKRKIELFKK